MTLEDLGYSDTLEKVRIEQNLDCYEIGRVAAVHKERCIVRSASRVYDSELLGNLRYTAKDRSDFPVVGDWVAISSYDDDHAIIYRVFPRKTVLERQAVGMFGEKQIIASNIDYSLIIQSVDRDFNINRLERYLTISSAARVIPVIILSKIDLIGEMQLIETMKRIKTRIDNIAIIPISNETKSGYEQLVSILYKGKTYCLLGSSGAGKSTLINNLSGQELMKTSSISLSTKKGRHITSHREMIVLEQGGIIIDNPGMREIGIADTTDGLENTFDEIIKYAAKCRFSDCSHLREKDCAVLEAVENGEIDKLLYENFLKLKRERDRFQSSIAEKRKKDKEFGKMHKEYKRLKKSGDNMAL